MSIIQNIRERGSWILICIVIALIAFILQDGVGRNNGNNDTSGVNSQQKISANQTKMLMSSLNN